ncbi:T-cell immunoreceptor with Ig and ITIM domains [Pelobates cultripes]|nr:T-cell immunoreceptor with Ig and ITIM domains [Pelobates cultripes]
MRLYLSPPGVLALCCFVIQIPGTQAGLYITTQNVTATSGSDVTLTCELSSPDVKLTQVNWKLCNGSYIAFHVQDRGHVKEAFAERVVLAERYGVKIRNVSYSDTGQYCCIFNVFPHGAYQGEIFLEVTDKMDSQLKLYALSGLGSVILAIIGCVGVFCYKRRSRRKRLNSSDQNEYVTNLAFPMVRTATMTTSQDAVTEEDCNGMEYFNILLYRNPL